tara:strand:- start:3403 stop:3609 length:207 start_codon:yes stop_codon:yes gene_type:complete
MIELLRLLAEVELPKDSDDTQFEWISKMTKEQEAQWDEYCIMMIRDNGKTLSQLHIDADILYSLIYKT